MATAVKRRAAYRTYESYGSVAYDHAYAPAEGAEGAVRERPVIRRRERVKSRARVMVRPAGYVAPTAVLGFLAVAVVAVMIVMCYVRITTASDEVVHLRNQSAALKEENSKLLSEYELAYDLKTVEEVATAQGGMVQPQPGQEVTMDLSEPDSAQVYRREASPVRNFWGKLTESVGNIVAFFR